MKKLNFLVIALIAILGFSSCDNNNWIATDYSDDLVGTWTCFDTNYAKALVIKEDGSVVATGVVDGEFFESKGTIKVENNKMIYTLENGDGFEGLFEIMPGESFSMVIDKELDQKFTYRYCKEDFSNYLIGLWVCTDGPSNEDDDMMIRTFSHDGKTTFTGIIPNYNVSNYILNHEFSYTVIGDLIFTKYSESNSTKYSAERFVYAPNGTSLGDIMTFYSPMRQGNDLVVYNTAYLRIKQELNFDKRYKYDYTSTHISNVKGKDEDITMMGYTFNTSKMDGRNLDHMLKSLLFHIEFPSTDSINYQYHYNNQNLLFQAPIEIEGNKVNIKMSEFSKYYRDVEMYMFQDAEDYQLHMYMHTKAFINYFANMDLAASVATGKVDLTNADEVNAVFDRMEDKIETINVSFVFKACE